MSRHDAPAQALDPAALAQSRSTFSLSVGDGQRPIVPELRLSEHLQRYRLKALQRSVRATGQRTFRFHYYWETTLLGSSDAVRKYLFPAERRPITRHRYD